MENQDIARLVCGVCGASSILSRHQLGTVITSTCARCYPSLTPYDPLPEFARLSDIIDDLRGDVRDLKEDNARLVAILEELGLSRQALAIAQDPKFHPATVAEAVAKRL